MKMPELMEGPISHATSDTRTRSGPRRKCIHERRLRVGRVPETARIRPGRVRNRARPALLSWLRRTPADNILLPRGARGIFSNPSLPSALCAVSDLVVTQI